jgi:Fe-S-cluster-containing hydrogenase component 2
MKIFINNRETEVLTGETLIETARRAGFDIPSLCYAKDAEHKSSCMICAVRNSVSGAIIPSCTTIPVDGMRIETDTPDVRQNRTLSLELLLSDHRADCEAPCSVACPANMDIAAMNRLYDDGKVGEALALLRDTLVIPATLCFVCNAPCERVCRRGAVDRPVPVREIKKRLVAATVLDATGEPVAFNGMRVAIAGSDPAALSAAYHLRKRGYETVLFEPSGQMLVPYVSADVPAEIIELETEVIRRMGVEMRKESFPDSIAGFDGVIRQSKPKQPARMVLEGRRMAESLHENLVSGKHSGGDDVATGGEVAKQRVFNSTCPSFTDSEKVRLGELPRTETDCLYCACEGRNDCRLRACATEYGVRSPRYAREEGANDALRRLTVSESIRFEPAKCIKCGLCVYNSTNGFTFSGRGFAMQVTLPEGNESNINTEITELCPTSALYLYI